MGAVAGYIKYSVAGHGKSPQRGCGSREHANRQRERSEKGISWGLWPQPRGVDNVETTEQCDAGQPSSGAAILSTYAKRVSRSALVIAVVPILWRRKPMPTTMLASSSARSCAS